LYEVFLIKMIMTGFMYILRCVNGRLYVGSTRDLEKRLIEHEAGEGANFTKDYLPVELVYYEEFDRIDDAFSREKQIQKWSRKKKEALIKGDFKELKRLAECRNETHFRNKK
jgi:putative endonuclease